MQVILQEFYKDLIDGEACRLVEHVSGHLQNHFHGRLSRGKEMTEWIHKGNLLLYHIGLHDTVWVA